jgi:hypothetical protein
MQSLRAKDGGGKNFISLYLARRHYISLRILKKGFLFTSWNMLAKPGKVVTDFVKGKRRIYPAAGFVLFNMDNYVLVAAIYSSKDLWRKCGDRLQRIFWPNINNKVCGQSPEYCFVGCNSIPGFVFLLVGCVEEVQLL